jgi:uncharacterized protein YqhQ
MQGRESDPTWAPFRDVLLATDSFSSAKRKQKKKKKNQKNQKRKKRCLIAYVLVLSLLFAVLGLLVLVFVIVFRLFDLRRNDMFRDIPRLHSKLFFHWTVMGLCDKYESNKRAVTKRSHT